MAQLTKGIFIVGAKRTAFGTMGGTLKDIKAADLAAIASKAAIAQAGLKPEDIDSAIVGNVLTPSSADGAFIARHAALKAGIPIEKPALTINRLCGSGFQSVVNAAQEIQCGVANIVLAGGAENMSASPFVARDIRFGTRLGAPYKLEDSLWEGLIDSYCQMPMGSTAEKLGEQFKITREEVDNYSLKSQQLWKAAQDGGRFKQEITPVQVKVKKQVVDFLVDEHPKPKATIEGLNKLPSIFKKNGLVTAGSASGICDGAGALVVAGEEAVKQKGLKPIARLVGYSVIGVDPTIMGIGPSPAIKLLLKACGKSLNDIDLIEINEAFAAQTLSCAKDLGLDLSKLNTNGGAVALGHPLGASGSRITAHLIYELKRTGKKFGIGSACIGGGQGIAVLVEAL